MGKKSYKWIVQLFSVELRKVMIYRVDFWLQFIMSIFANVGVAYFLWKAIFEYKNVDMMGGFSFHSLMFYYLMVPVIGKLITGPGFANFAQEIYDGSLTRYLIFPVSFFLFRYTTFLAGVTLYFSQFILAIFLFLFFFGIPPDISLSWASFLMTACVIFGAGLLSFTLYSVIEMVAFWADNVWSLVVTIRYSVSLMGGGLIPLSFFPDIYQKILYFLPFSYMVNFPINCFLGRISLSQFISGMCIITLWILVFGMLTFIIWEKGRYKYTGVGI
jgi:ABC-2 type transport system permease protein